MNKNSVTEKELIGKIRELRQIKPRKDWVLLTKTQILGDVEVRPQHFLFPFFKQAYAGIFVVLLLIGLFEFSQSALPGEPLYFVKGISEKAAAVFVSQEEKPKMNLELANKRLEELNQIVQNNEVKKLVPAISDFQANISKAAESLAKTKNSDVPEIVSEIKKIKETKENIESSLATKFGDNEIRDLDSASLQLIKREIEYLEGRTLTDSQKELLIQAQKDLEAGDFEDALLKIYSISNQQQ